MQSYFGDRTRIRASAEWLEYFERNTRALLEIPWHAGPELTPQEHLTVRRSVQEFQRGESSEGRRLLGYARRYAARTGDPEYLEALRLFIAEEQRHARDLGRFLAINGIPLATRSPRDRAFRALRHVAGTLEASIGVLLTAEIIAQVYYVALQRATNSRVLRRLCEQILRDEDMHVRFQAQQLGKLRARRGQLHCVATMTAHRILFAGTCLVVWGFHRRALEGGGYNLSGFWHAAWEHFDRAFAASASARGHYRTLRSWARLNPDSRLARYVR
jgi:rubrerythrin